LQISGFSGSIGGWAGLGLFLVQAFTAMWQLELVNYVEHYGLTRKHLGMVNTNTCCHAIHGTHRNWHQPR
jgi:hypothetical protein